MIATHSNKALDARMKQEPIRARIAVSNPAIFASHLLPLRYFAAPFSAADIRDERELAAESNSQHVTLDEIGIELPDIQDGRIKQVLVPYLNDYAAVTPVPSLAVMTALNEEKLANHHWHCLQPVSAAASNHGDPVAAKAGFIKLQHNKTEGDMYSGRFHKSHVLFTAEVQNLNLSSCYVSMGLPALTGIGGAVHVLERETGLSLPFGFGIKNVQAITHASRGTNSHRTALKHQKAMPAVISNEITGSAEIALILECDDAENAGIIMAACEKLHRIGGGTVFNSQAQYVTDKTLPAYFWFASFDGFQTENWTDYMTAINQHGAALVQSGYAMLEQPTPKKLARNYPHAWAEPVFSLLKLNSPPDFFTLQHVEGDCLMWSSTGE